MIKYYSELNISEEKDLLLLKTTGSGYLNLEYSNAIDEKVELTITEENYKPINEFQNLTKEEILIITFNLINIITYKPEHINFDINFTNIYLNELLDVKVYIRKLREGQKDYLTDIKAFVIALLKGVSFEQIRSSDLKKYKSTLNIYNIETLEAIKIVLNEELRNYKFNKSKTYKEVKIKKYNNIRNRNIFKNIAIIILMISLVSSYFYFYTFSEDKVSAYNAYLNQDYNAVVSELNKYMESNRLSEEEEVMLVKSIINTQNITDSQKEVLLSSIDKNLNDDLKMYWSSIADADYESAITSAQVLQSRDLETYAIIKYLDYLEINPSEDKDRAELIKTLEDQYRQIEDEKTKEIEDALKEEVEQTSSEVIS